MKHAIRKFKHNLKHNDEWHQNIKEFIMGMIILVIVIVGFAYCYDNAHNIFGFSHNVRR
ncbi:hypothetical protein [Ligilactobacillus equi]|uniref:Uncharacterized protein n=1 Tax=Ligilactobacillus equi DSM 15833 = JCM 10991 TaxID=1423740 RepID=A0A0R1TSW1_9LACO|nr:hypothetical protein [Ligilactobacillus equi]KRL84428.1 hypothetical protein FC36_GL000186 [Ligilactobacillus equi DSM 15833 = JCM 10991]